MAKYIYDDDESYKPYEEIVGDGSPSQVTPDVPHEDVWKMWARSQKVDTNPVIQYTGVNVGEGEEYNYVENPAFTKFKQQAKDAGYKIGMSDIPGYKYDKNFTIFNPEGTPIGEPIRLQTGQGFFSSISDLAKQTAPVWMSALTFGGGAAALGSMIAPGASATTQAALGNALISGGTTALGGGDIGDVLKSAGIAAATPYIGQNVSPAASEALGGGATGAAGSAALRSGITQLLSTGEIDPEKLALSAVAGGVKGYVPDVPSGGTGEEGFFDIGGEGYSPYEEQYGFVADPMPSEDYFDALIRDIEPGIPYTEAPYDDILADLNLPAEQPSVYTGDVQDLYGGSGDLFTPSVEHDLSQLPQADYSNEGRNYPTPESTVDSPINITTDIGLGNRYLVDINDIIGAPAPAPKAAPAPTAPKPSAPTAAPAPAAQKGLDLGALMAMLGGMYGAQEEAAPEYAPARVTNVSPFGLPYGMRG